MTQNRDAYKTGQIVPLPADQADQWVADGVAVAVDDDASGGTQQQQTAGANEPAPGVRKPEGR
jgi:hypothetical protein